MHVQLTTLRKAGIWYWYWYLGISFWNFFGIFFEFYFIFLFPFSFFILNCISASGTYLFNPGPHYVQLDTGPCYRVVPTAACLILVMMMVALAWLKVAAI